MLTPKETLKTSQQHEGANLLHRITKNMNGRAFEYFLNFGRNFFPSAVKYIVALMQ